MMEDKAGRTQYFEWGSVEWLYEPEDSDAGHPSAALVTVAVGKKQQAHTHAGFEQFLYILSGVGTQWTSGAGKTVKHGMLIHNLPHIKHAIANSGDTPLSVLTIYLPIPYPSILGESDLVEEEKHQAELDLELTNVAALQHLQDNVARAMNMAAITIDTRGNPLTQSSGISQFCHLVRLSPEGNARCNQSELQAGLRAARLKKPLVFDCYLGITNVVAPILLKDKSIGSVICGQVLLKEPEDADMENIAKAGFPVEQLKPAFQNLPVISKSRIYTAAELLSSISYHFVEMGQRYYSQRRLAQELLAKAEMVELLKQTELQALQAQISPHFLFNTLNAIANLALLENAPQTREMVFTLSELMRYALRSVSHMVTIRQEAEHVQRYLLIQQRRFNDRLHVTIQVEPDILDAQIPALTLQPLVENAIVHGLRDRKVGRVRLQGRQAGEWCIVQIMDDGVGMSEEKLKEITQAQTSAKENHVGSIGIDNVRRRLQHHFGTEFSFDIESTVESGTMVRIKIPCRVGEESHYA